MIEDVAILDRAWAIAAQPVTCTRRHMEAVLDLVTDDEGKVCPRALQMFELAVEVAAMHDGTLTALHAAWTRSQFLAPAPLRRAA